MTGVQTCALPICIGSFDDMGYFDDIELRGVEIKKGKAEGKPTPKK